MSQITFPVDATHIMLFARALGDENPVYRDAAYSARGETGGIIAPPTFPAAVMHFDPAQLRPRPGADWLGSGAAPTGVADAPPPSGSLQAGQEYVYHRAIRPGDVLTVETKPGKVWEKASKRGDGGKLVFRERISDYRDADGELVVTAIGVGVTVEAGA